MEIDSFLRIIYKVIFIIIPTLQHDTLGRNVMVIDITYQS